MAAALRTHLRKHEDNPAESKKLDKKKKVHKQDEEKLDKEQQHDEEQQQPTPPAKPRRHSVDAAENKCDSCAKVFSWPDVLRCHISVQHHPVEAKKLVCPRYNKEFLQPSSFHHHVNKVDCLRKMKKDDNTQEK